ncbi:MAG: adenine deaminase [archaeon]|nr:MAG: adenine deaminase [archaeon]
MQLKANFVDVRNGRIYPALINFGERINSVEKVDEKFCSYIIPGLIESHVHIESSMLTPSRFAHVAVAHGTTAVVADPHEIANVLGMEGINFMRDDAGKTPLKMFFTAPSCVPATGFETSGASLDAGKINQLLQEKDVVALGEMMNFPGVIQKDPEVMKKIKLAKKHGKPVDGHCPGLTGEKLEKYIEAGITTEHECTTLAEAEEKLKKGMKIMIREGSSAKNMKEVYSLAKKNPEKCFIVSDDIHADDLLKGHMNLKLKKIVSLGIDPIDAIRMSTTNPANHYNLEVGLLSPGDPADFIVVNNLKDFDVLETYINGKLVARNSKTLFQLPEVKILNSFDVEKKNSGDLKVNSKKEAGTEKVNVIGIVENQVITEKLTEMLRVENFEVLPDSGKDILRIVVAERYGQNNITLGFIRGFGLKEGAVASSVAHDSHNIVAIGLDKKDVAKAINTVIEMRGGINVVNKGQVLVKLPLPIAGLMNDKPAKENAEKLDRFNNILKELGCKLNSPLMILSFMSLPVIPEIKITDRGLFDVEKFGFIDLIGKEN